MALVAPYSVMPLIAYRVRRNSGIIGYYGHEQPNHGRGFYRVP